jgi:hypothetical protein
MTKPTIVTRAGKGSALTWTEGDANLTNLRDATITVTDGTNSKAIDLNGTITYTAGTNVTLSVNSSTGALTINSTGGGATAITGLSDVQITSPSTNQVLKYSSATSKWVNGAGGIDGLYADTNPSLGGNLTVMGYSIISSGNGNINITPNGTGSIVLEGQSWPQADGTANQVLKTNGSGQLSWTDVTATSATNATNATNIGITNQTNTNSNFYPTFSSGTSGNNAAGVSTDLYYNPFSGNLYAGTFVGNLSGSATNASNIYINSTDGNASDTTMFVALVPANTTGNQGLHTDIAGLTYNASTNTLTATTFSGGLSGAHNGTVGATTPSSGVFTSISTNSTLTANNTTGPKLTIGTGAVSSSAWTTTGIGIRASAATYTDTTSTTGTIAASHVHAISTPLIASTNTITVTDAATFYVAAAPTASTNTTITNGWAILSGGKIKATDFTGTIGATTASTGAFTTLSASSTVSGTGFSTYLASPPAIGGTAAAAGTFTTLTSTGRTVLKDLTETVYTSGSTTGTITPDVANGTVQKITLTGSITFSAFANPVAGQSMTLIITQSASGGLTLTSTMKFAGGSKTLSTAANAIDILTVFYDGSTYYASLGKGFA